MADRRPLLPLPVGTGPAALDALRPALAAALDGTGPALLPLPASDPALARRLAAAVRSEEPVPGDVALVLPTSGSTGRPKGVLLTADALRAAATASIGLLGGPARWLLALPTTHVGGLQVVVRSLVGGTPVQAVDASAGFTAAAFVAATERLGAGRRATSLVPTQLGRLLDGGAGAVAALASYDVVLLGGALAPPTVLRRARAAGVRVVGSYGMTETSGGCVYDGVPFPGVRVAVDGDGRVRLAGPVLARGYRGGAAADDAAFTADGWFRTSDAGRLDAAGRLEVLGRLDDVIVTGGEKVPAAAVEAELCEHPAVAEVAVVGVPDTEWGERVEAVVVPRDPGAPPTLEDVRRHVAAAIGAVAAPRSLRLVDALPLLTSGKVDRRTLAGRG